MGVEEVAPPASALAPRATPVPSAPPSPPPGPPALAGPEFVDLDVEGFHTAVVRVPVGAREPRPVVLALHGNFDRPEWQCQVWHDIVGPAPWVLCPRGVPRSDAPKSLDRWTYAGAHKLEQEIARGLAALSASYAGYVDLSRPIFTGFSLGAILGVTLLARKQPSESYQAAVLVEGGYSGWHLASVKAFAAQGGKRVLFACGQSACQQASRQAKRAFDRHDLLTEVVSGGNVGHTYDGKVADAVRSRWSFVVGDDPRFSEPPERR